MSSKHTARPPPPKKKHPYKSRTKYSLEIMFGILLLDAVAAALHSRLQHLLQMTHGVPQSASESLCVSVLAAVKGRDGEVDVVRLRVVTDGVAVRNERTETHHAVRVVCRHLKRQDRREINNGTGP